MSRTLPGRPLRVAVHATLVALALLAPLAAARAQEAQPPLRAARAAAVGTPLRDDDLTWIAPLMAVQAGDQRRDVAQTAVAVAALRDHASDAAGAARVARLADGTRSALDELRGYSALAVAPPQARYGAGCSAELTRRSGALATTASFHVPDVGAARDFYRRHGWEVLGDRASGFVLRSPDRKLHGTLGAPGLRALVGHLERNGVDESGLRAHCAEQLDGQGLVLTVAGALESEVQAERARGAAAAADPLRLPAALRQVGLTAAQWDAVWAVIVQAQSDEMLVAQPGALERDAATAADAARRRANVDWYRRNRAAVDAAIRPVMGGA